MNKEFWWLALWLSWSSVLVLLVWFHEFQVTQDLIKWATQEILSLNYTSKLSNVSNVDKKHRSSLDVGTSILSDQHPSGPICFTWIIKNNYVKKTLRAKTRSTWKIYSTVNYKNSQNSEKSDLPQSSLFIKSKRLEATGMAMISNKIMNTINLSPKIIKDHGIGGNKIFW